MTETLYVESQWMPIFFRLLYARLLGQGVKRKHHRMIIPICLSDRVSNGWMISIGKCTVPVSLCSNHRSIHLVDELNQSCPVVLLYCLTSQSFDRKNWYQRSAGARDNTVIRLSHALVWHSFLEARESLAPSGSVPGGNPEKVPRKKNDIAHQGMGYLPT